MQLGVGLQRTGSCRKLKVKVMGRRWDLVVAGAGEVRDPGTLLPGQTSSTASATLSCLLYCSFVCSGSQFLPLKLQGLHPILP